MSNKIIWNPILTVLFVGKYHSNINEPKFQIMLKDILEGSQSYDPKRNETQRWLLYTTMLYHIQWQKLMNIWIDFNFNWLIPLTRNRFETCGAVWRGRFTLAEDKLPFAILECCTVCFIWRNTTAHKINSWMISKRVPILCFLYIFILTTISLFNFLLKVERMKLNACFNEMENLVNVESF